MARITTDVAGGDTGSIGQYNNLRREAEASSRLLASAQAVPNNTLRVSEGAVYFGLTRVDYAGGNTSAFADTASTNRIDCLSISPAGALVITQGVEGASPAEPACPTANIPICFVYIKHGFAHIDNVSDGTNAYIYKDTRNIMNLVKEARTYWTEVSNANPAINTDLYDRYELTAQAVAVSSFSTNLSGTPKKGDRLNIKISPTAPTTTFVNKTAYSNGTSISSHVVNKPANTADGDIMFAFVSSEVAYLNSIPAGWTRITQATNTRYFDLFYKIASGEGASYTWGFASNTNYPSITIATYRGGFDPSNPIQTFSNTYNSNADTSVTAGSITTISAGQSLFFFASSYWGGGTSFTKPTVPSSAWVEDSDQTGSSLGQEVCSLLNWTSFGATGAITATQNQSASQRMAFAVAVNISPTTIAWGASFTAQDYTLATSISSPTTFNFIYNGSTWATYSILDKVSSVLGTFDMASANGAKYYPHGLGKVPSRIRIKGVYISSTTNSSESFGVYDNLNQNKCIYLWQKEGSSTAVADVAGNSNTQAIILSSDATSSNQQVGVVTVDATNVIITWTKTGSPTGTAYLLLEAE